MACAAVALLAGVAAAPAADEVVKGAELTDEAGDDFYVTSSGSDEWTIRGTSAKPKVVEWIAKPVPAADDPRERQGIAALWAKKCEKGRQKVHFRRSFFLAGPEYSLGALIEPIIRGRGGFHSVELRVNGIRILKIKGSADRVDPAPGDLKHLRFGSNNIDVIAVKRASDKGVKCNVSKATGFGVAFLINGEFGTDTGLLEPAAGDAKRSVSGQSAVDETIKWEVRNNGPGGAANMGLNVQLGIPSGGGIKPIVEPKTGGQVKSCDVGSYVNDDFQPVISCKIKNVPAGGRVAVPIRIVFKLPDRPFRSVTMYMAWSVRGGGEEVGNLSNNRREAKIHYCDSDATGPPCESS